MIGDRVASLGRLSSPRADYVFAARIPQNRLISFSGRISRRIQPLRDAPSLLQQDALLPVPLSARPTRIPQAHAGCIFSQLPFRTPGRTNEVDIAASSGRRAHMKYVRA